ILAAITTFAVKGIGDRGLGASTSTDSTIIRTAEEADCSQNGHYDSAQGLITAKLLATNPTYNGVIAGTNLGIVDGIINKGCGTTANNSYIIGQTASFQGNTLNGGNNTLIAEASNAWNPFSFMAAPNGPFFQFSGTQVQITPGGSSGTLAGNT